MLDVLLPLDKLKELASEYMLNGPEGNEEVLRLLDENERLRKEVEQLRDDLLLVTKERDSALHWLNLPLRVLNDT